MRYIKKILSPLEEYAKLERQEARLNRELMNYIKLRKNVQFYKKQLEGGKNE